MTFDFLTILLGLGATVLGLGAWFIRFAHSNDTGQKAILVRLEAISALLKSISERDRTVDERSREWQMEQRRIADGLTQVAEIAKLLSQGHHENRIQQRAEHERLVRLGIGHFCDIFSRIFREPAIAPVGWEP